MSQHNPLPIDADDPGLTAFALGELDGPEAAVYAEAVAASAELQAIVAAIQADAHLLSSELQLEPKVTMSAERRAEIVARVCPDTKTLATVKRYFGMSRQTAAVAASLLLVPAGWYGFRAIMPPVKQAPIIAHQDVHNLESDRWRTVNGPEPLVGRKQLSRLNSELSLSEMESGLDSDGEGVDRKVVRESVMLAARDRGPDTSAVNGGSVRVAEVDHGVSNLLTAPPSASKPGQPQAVDSRFGNVAVGKEIARPRRGYSASGDEIADKPVIDGLQVVEGKNQTKKFTKAGKDLGDLADLSKQGDNSDHLISDGTSNESGASTKFSLDTSGKPAADKAPMQREKGGAKSSGGSQSGNGQPTIGVRRKKKAAENSESKPRSESQPGASEGEDRLAGLKGDAGLKTTEGLDLYSVSEKQKEVNDIKERLHKAESERSRGDKLYSFIELNGKAGESKSKDGKPSDEKGSQNGESAPNKRELGDLERQGQKSDRFEDSEAVARVTVELDPYNPKELAKLRQTYEDRMSDESYQPIYENSFLSAAEQQLSTFSIDVDTASYANLRRFIQGGQLPPPDAVRIEELVNYFAYAYPQPQDGRPFSVQADIAACPWQPNHQLVRVGLKGKEIPKAERPPTNLVFLVDVSGSMSPANKLPLVRESLKTLVNQLDERDRIAIVTYAGEAGIPLQSTSVAQRETIINAIDSLGAGGSTNGAAGINTAYDIAAKEFLEKGTNRVILCTDGDFNVGVTSDEALVQMIQTRAKGGVFLSIFGFGMGNLKDSKLEQLADKGNGQYGYIDDQQEANKVFVEEMMGTLVTIAKDVKIQVDFNKDAVASYRLVGYENRVMAAEDFHNDKKDAGEIGSGHTVTALYEIVPVKDLKVDDKTRWLTVKLRYKQPEATDSVLFETPLAGPAGQLKLAPSDFQFAAGVAATGMLLRHSQHAGQANWGLVKELVQSGLSFDPNGHRRSFLGLVSQAESLMGQLRPASPPAPESTVRGKYKSLLRRLNVPGDSEKYGQFNDYGYSDTKTYGGAGNLPAGYWVYVAPYWYIWAESNEPTVKK